MKIERFANWGMASKVAMATIATAVPLALVLFFYVMPEMERSIYAQKAASIRQVVDIAYSLVGGIRTG